MKKITGLMALAVLLNVSFSAPARGAACTSVEKLESEDDDCHSNGKYVEAGASCLKGLEKEIQQATRGLKGRLKDSSAKVMGDGRASQNSTLGGSAAGYAISAATLDALLASARAARQGLDQYAQNVIYPEDFDAEPETIGDQEEFLNSQLCYAEPRDMLQAMLDKADQHIKDLEEAKATSTALESGSAVGQETLNNEGLSNRAAKPAGTKGQGAGRASNVRIQGQGSLGGSDISGTENLNKPKQAPVKK